MEAEFTTRHSDNEALVPGTYYEFKYGRAKRYLASLFVHPNGEPVGDHEKCREPITKSAELSLRS
jgi:hypothetical protein